MPGGLTLLISTNANIPTPSAGKCTVFFSSDLNQPAYKDDVGVVHALAGATGAQGSQGVGGPPGFALDGIDGDAPVALPGPQGNAGPTGAQGPMGPTMVPDDVQYLNEILSNPTPPSSAVAATEKFTKTWETDFPAAGTVIQTFAGATSAGSATQPGLVSNRAVIRYTSAGSATAGVRVHTNSGSASALTFGAALPKAKFVIVTGTDVTLCRYWIGIRPATATPAGDTENNNVVFRYSTNVPDAGWTGITIDGSGNLNTTGNILAIAGDTVYELIVEYLSTTQVKFTVNGVSATITHATQIPTTVAVTAHCTVTALTASGRVIDISMIKLEAF